MVATAFEATEAPSRGRRSPELPIGRPIANTEVYLLDANMELVPLGLPGELYIGGEGVARCYLHRPGRTAERFVPDPFGDRAGARLFRTGDRARWRPDGQLEFLGRVDHQVKIRGFRVEPAEVEAVLRRHPAVGESGRRGPRGRGRPPATGGLHRAPRATPSPTVAELRRWLLAALPEYMVPSAFVTLEALPLTPNGKIDRKALPDPRPSLLDPAAEYVPPRTPWRRLSRGSGPRCWSSDRVGVHDNFFDLGGHSLQSVQLVSRLSAALGRAGLGQDRLPGPDDRRDGGGLEREAAAVANGSHRDDIAALARWLLEADPPTLPEHVSDRGTPVPVSLFAGGELAPVDAVAVSYFPSALLHSLGLDRQTVIHDWCGNRPVIADIRQTPLGRIGTVMIPRFEDQLYSTAPTSSRSWPTPSGWRTQIGATTVSLTGLLPSATRLRPRPRGRALAGQDLPRITTGHATTTSAVVLAVRRALRGSRPRPDRRARRLHRPGLGRRRDAPTVALVPAASRAAEPVRRLLEARGARIAPTRAGRRAGLPGRGAAARLAATRCRTSSTRPA